MNWRGEAQGVSPLARFPDMNSKGTKADVEMLQRQPVDHSTVCVSDPARYFLVVTQAEEG